MTPRLLPLTLIFSAFLAAPRSATAVIWWDHYETLRPRGERTPHLTGTIRAYKLTPTHGRPLTVRLPRPAALDGTLTLPAGDWAELTLLLDGPATLELGPVQVNLDVDSLTVPLAEPGASEIHLEWTLPAALVTRLEQGERSGALTDQLGLALQDGGLASP